MLNKLLKYLSNHNIKILLYLDFILLPLALFTSVFLRLGGEWDMHLNHSWWVFILLSVWTIPIFIKLGLYRAVVKYLDAKIVVIVLYGVSLSVFILIAVIYFAKITAFPKSAVLIFWIFALAYIGGSRLILRGMIRNLMYSNKNLHKKKIAIYGAGHAGVQLCLGLQNTPDYSPVLFIDDDYKKSNTLIRGITVFNPTDFNEIQMLIENFSVDQIVIAIPSLSLYRRQEIIRYLEPLAVKILTLPAISQLMNGNITISDIKEIEIEDLLGRDVIPADHNLLEKNINNLNVLVTGAGGSIGSELVKQIILLKPSLLILFELSEFFLYKIDHELKSIITQYNTIHKDKIKTKVIIILGSVLNIKLLDNIIMRNSINTIYHAAAYKHVPIVEFNPITGVENNVIGTYNLAITAMQHQVQTMVLISTDKAVRPTNVMGASKRIAEMILQALNYSQDFTNQQKKTIFTMVRFGNVLGSSGSVVPLFKEQIKNGGPITVTDPEVIRYFMTISEAVQLVIQASSMATGGEVFVLDMGQSVKIVDLAKRMIHLSGLTIKDDKNPNGDIAIKFTGLRPGEKLYEELLINDNAITTKHPRIQKANEVYLEYSILLNYIKQLEVAITNYNAQAIIHILQQLVNDKIGNSQKNS